MAHLVLIEDDDLLRQELILSLTKAGYKVTGLAQVREPEAELASLKPDLVILDLGLPGLSGLQLCSWFKAGSTVPVLVLTARDSLKDELKALDLGAADYLTKPCHPERLLARIKNLLELSSPYRQTCRAGQLFLDTSSGKLTWHDHVSLLPETENKLLACLIRAYPAAVAGADILEQVWGTEHYLDENILAVNLTRLRKKLRAAGPGLAIQAVRGSGYRLEVAGK